MTLYCSFDNFLSQALRHRFVYGLKDQAIQRWLLVVADLMLQKALDIALSKEVAEKSTQQLVQSDVGIQEIHGLRKGIRTLKKSC